MSSKSRRRLSILLTALVVVVAPALRVEGREAAAVGQLVNIPVSAPDWSPYAVLRLPLQLSARSPAEVEIAIEAAGGTATFVAEIEPGKPVVLDLPIFQLRYTSGYNWLKSAGVSSLSSSGRVDTTKVRSLTVKTKSDKEQASLTVLPYSLEKPVKANGWVDRFGQNDNLNFAGKVQSELELTTADEEEDLQLRKGNCFRMASNTAASAGATTERDEYGAWRNGRKVESTSDRHETSRFFSCRQIDGCWWLVAPNGNLYYASGLDCVGMGSDALLDQTSKGAYSWLPPAEGDLSTALSKDGVNLYKCNLLRKWGKSDLERRFLDKTLARLQSWGFNCLGDWSQEALQKAQRIPYTSMGPATWDVRIPFIVGDLCDVYHPDFEKEARRVAESLSASKDDKWLIGYFLDNELPWHSLAYCLQGLDEKSHAKMAWIKLLRNKYKTIEALNLSWDTHAVSFEALRWPGDDAANDAAKADMARYRADFAERFYSVWCDAIRHADPHHLVLGSRLCDRFEEVIAACARHSDVVSFNSYSLQFDRKEFDRYYANCKKPFLIGEFAFDSLDAGLLTMYVPVANQKERADRFEQYAAAAAAAPYFVGAHYFQYIDEPITGRARDRETAFNGFVSVVDVPYPDLVKAAISVNQRLYCLHAFPEGRRPN